MTKITDQKKQQAAISTLSKALIVYSSKPPIISYLQRAFGRVGVETDYLQADKSTWFDKWIIHRANKWLHNLRLLPKNQFAFSNHPLAHKNFRSNELERKIEEFKPDLVLLVRGISFSHESLKKAPCLFGWWIEREERVAEALRELDLFDWYFFMNRSCVECAIEHGFNNASYLPHSVDAEAFRPVLGTEKKYDLCFVGNWSPKRQAYMKAALKITSNIVIYGRGWRKNNLTNLRLFSCVKGTYIDGDELNRLYNSSHIVLNVTNWGNSEGKKRSGMNMRVLEVPATGSFLLTDGARELTEFLLPNTHVATYEGLDEFVAQIVHWLDRPEERSKIAEQGRTHVVTHFSYDQLVDAMVTRYLGLQPNILGKVCDSLSENRPLC
jgi:spore maturation protein CgeB